MPDLKKAELIYGIVFMGSPVRLLYHGVPHARLNGLLFTYSTATPGLIAANNSSTRLGEDSMPQPDVLLMIEPARGGQAWVSEDDYVEGAPELVAEVASSSVSFDLHLKKKLYKQYGAREYLVWRVFDEQVDWFVLRNGEYEPLPPGPDGILRSEVFPGLWLNPAAMIGGDMAAAVAVLRRGLASPEHAAFVDRLKPREAT
jgi:Uma2 family endonuclease